MDMAACSQAAHAAGATLVCGHAAYVCVAWYLLTQLLLASEAQATTAAAQN